jgi:uncharacterized membrane protein
VEWLDRHRWQLLAGLIALAVILRMVHVREWTVTLAVFVLVMLGIALFAPRSLRLP